MKQAAQPAKKKFTPRIEVFNPFKTPFRTPSAKVVSEGARAAHACSACTACTACR